MIVNFVKITVKNECINQQYRLINHPLQVAYVSLCQLDNSTHQRELQTAFAFPRSSADDGVIKVQANGYAAQCKAFSNEIEYDLSKTLSKGKIEELIPLTALLRGDRPMTITLPSRLS